MFGSTLTAETTFGLTYINVPEPVRGSEQGVALGARVHQPGVFKNGLDQIPSFSAWNNGPTLFNPGGFDPELFAKKWLVSIAQNVTKVAGAHTIKVASTTSG